MEIKSKKMPKTEKMQKMCILLGAIIIIIVLVFMPNGFISAINAIKMKQLSVWELMIMSFCHLFQCGQSSKIQCLA